MIKIDNIKSGIKEIFYVTEIRIQKIQKVYKKEINSMSNLRKTSLSELNIF